MTAEQLAARLDAVISKLQALAGYGEQANTLPVVAEAIVELQALKTELASPPPSDPIERASRFALFLDGLKAQDPLGGLRLRVQDYLNAGVTPSKLLVDLEAFRGGLSDSQQEVVLEVMDLLAGWCSPDAAMRGLVPEATAGRPRKSLDGGKTWIPQTDEEIAATERWAREVWPGYDDPNSQIRILPDKPVAEEE